MTSKIYLEEKLPNIIWALILIWWGLRWSLLISLPEGSGMLGTSLILLGANGVRKSAGLPINPNSTFLGLFSLLSGGILVTFAVLKLQFQPPVFETFLIVLGVMILGCSLSGTCRQTSSE